MSRRSNPMTPCSYKCGLHDICVYGQRNTCINSREWLVDGGSRHLCDGVGVVRDHGGVLAALCHSENVALDEMTDADVLGRWQTIVDEQTEVVHETTQVA